ncbi:ABC transporter, ATP-binding protein [Aedoeadaptatus nemausensis]|uniref:ABC transporter, ATP-binding protein n=1 Tax=Aedoeadaptatus nemausensis TaxID=2582829 RepID=A0A6V6Y0W3_9FIRM|nr:ATP-binding cassette domain-containing protein [Peptoniphilus nemausensis]CAC9925780.1 ABC transporter, ATP-binding protein [Peptoniphilus nemausensis]
MTTSPSNVLLKADGITRSFGDQVILKDLNLEVERSKIVTLLGQSGSGKTTLFNILAGLDHPDSGTVTLLDEDITAKPGHVAYMLQKDLLLKHLKIIDNVSLPLRLKRASKEEARKEADQYFQEFGLEGTQMKFPSALSGGMAQRAAFLRTILFSKELVLLDEPFSRLDAITKMKLQDWYLEIKEKYHLTTIFITHDIDEALRMSDHIHVLSPSLKSIGFSYHVPEGERNDFLASKEYLEAKKSIQEAILQS